MIPTNPSLLNRPVEWLHGEGIHELNLLPLVLSRPVYLVVCGGIAVGKTHVVRKHITNYKVADIDDYMGRNGFTDYDRQGEQFTEAMRQIAIDIEDLKRNKFSLVSMGTGSNYDFLKYRLTEARQDGYLTALLHVTASIDQAVAQNQERYDRGDRAVAPDQLKPIYDSHTASQVSVNRIRREDSHLLDYFCIYRNQRVG